MRLNQTLEFYKDKMVAFSRLNCCGANPWALVAIGWSTRIYQ